MKTDDAVAWLRNALGDRVVTVLDLQLAAKEAGIGKQRLKLSRSILHVEAFRKERYGPYFVCLPGVEHDGEYNPEDHPRPLTERQQAAALLAGWRAAKNGSVGSAPALFDQVEWVGEWLLTPIDEIPLDSIPCGGAMSLLCWSRKNENDFRQLYDCKRMERVAARPAAARRGKVSGMDRLMKPDAE